MKEVLISLSASHPIANESQISVDRQFLIFLIGFICLPPQHLCQRQLHKKAQYVRKAVMVRRGWTESLEPTFAALERTPRTSEAEHYLKMYSRRVDLQVLELISNCRFDLKL